MSEAFLLPALNIDFFLLKNNLAQWRALKLNHIPFHMSRGKVLCNRHKGTRSLWISVMPSPNNTSADYKATLYRTYMIHFSPQTSY